MQIKVVRDYSGEEGSGPQRIVLAGQKFDVEEDRARDLIRVGLAVELEGESEIETDDQDDGKSDDKADGDSDAKADEKSPNKAAQKPADKAAKKPEHKAG